MRSGPRGGLKSAVPPPPSTLAGLGLGWEKERLDLIEDVIYSSRFSSLGKYTYMFEDLCSEFWKRTAVSCSSGSTALFGALRWARSKGRRSIMVADLMLPLVANIVKMVFGKIFWIDVLPEYLQPSCEIWRNEIDRHKPDVLLLCHTAGLLIPGIEDLKDYAEEKKILIIEDFSHAHGVKNHGVVAGEIGDVSLASFYATKVLTAGEGGIVLVDDWKEAEWFREFFNAGKDRKENFKRVGLNFRMSELNACIGVVDMKHKTEIFEQRRRLAGLYNKYAGDISLQDLMEYSTYYKYTVMCEKNLVKAGVETTSKTFDYSVKGLPGSVFAMKNHYNLLLYRGMPDEEVILNAKKYKEVIEWKR
jgi:perosamine synthetase